MPHLLSHLNISETTSMDYNIEFKGYRSLKCFVTGHTGFKGAWLTQWLDLLGAEISAYALPPETDPNLYSETGSANNLTDVEGDLNDYLSLKTAMDMSSPEVIFHLGAQALVRRSYREPKYTFNTNVGGTVNVLEAARNCPSVKAVVIITSDKSYYNNEWHYGYRENDRLGGKDPYSASKASAEIVTDAYYKSFFKDAGVGVATARAGNVIGGGDWAEDRIIPDAVRALTAGQPVSVRHPSAVRPWQHVLEPLSGYLLLGSRLLKNPEKYSGPWNFGPPADSAQSVASLMDQFIESYGEGRWEDVSAQLGAQPLESTMLMLAWDKAHRILNWKPRWDFTETVERTAAWYKAFYSGKDVSQLCKDELSDYMLF